MSDERLRHEKAVRIYNKRRALDMNQRDLAKKVGVSHVTISNWERGIHVLELAARNEAALVRALRTNEKWLNTGLGSDGPEGAMTDDEIDLVERYRNMSDSEKARFLDYAEFAVSRSQQSPPTDSD